MTTSPASGDKKRYGLGQNIFGNSYTAAVDIAGFANSFPQEVEKTVYIYNTGSVSDWNDKNGVSGSTGAGAWIAVPAAQAGKGSLPKSIPALQGFLLKFTDAETKYGNDVTVTLPYTQGGNNVMEANDHAQYAKPMFGTRTETEAAGRGNLMLTLRGDRTTDVLYEFQEPGCTDGFDNGWDGSKLGWADGSIYAETPDGRMQVNSVPSLVGQTISIIPGKETQYELTIKREGLGEGLVLKDMVAGKEVALNDETTTYLFTTDGDNAKGVGRFVIAGSTTGIDSNLASASSLIVDNGAITAVNADGGKATITVNTVGGATVASHAFEGTHGTFAPQLAQGIYLVTLRTPKQTLTRKYIIK